MQEKIGFNIIILDIDDFKFINDTYGHVIGDNIIAGTASGIEKILDKKYKIFRYGWNNVLEYADECLYESKSTGKNKYTVR